MGEMSKSKMGKQRDKHKIESIKDDRFAAAQTDPRFHRFPRAKRKVEIDDRFSGMFKDKAFQVKNAVDKRGRKLQRGKAKEDMRKYYRLQNEEQADKALNGPISLSESSGKLKTKSKPKMGANLNQKDLKDPLREASEKASSSDDLNEEELEREKRWARARGLTGPQNSSDEEEDDSSSEESEDELENFSDEDIDLKEWGVGALPANLDEEAEYIQDEDVTKRLAVLDLDWSKVKAVDIFVMLQSFLKKGQKIEKVTVYPSDYGLKRMADEARFGPKGLTTSKNEEDLGNENKKIKQKGGFEMSAEERAEILEALNEEESDFEASEGSDEEEEEEEDEDEDDLESEDEDEDLVQENGGSDHIDQVENKSRHANDFDQSDSKLDKKSRRLLQIYEQSRFKYYYAIVDCKDTETALHLLNECGHMEFEHSANQFELRSVPDKEDFSKREVREEANEIPIGYKAPEIGAASMLHTNPKLSWDADDEGRKKALIQRVSKDKLRDDDFKAYLGSDSDEEENTDQKETDKKARYKQLLNGASNGTKHGKDWMKENNFDEEEDSENESEKQGVQEESKMEMEVTFGGGLDDLSHKLRMKQEEKANKKSDTVWEAYLRRRREKKQQAKGRHRGKGESDDDIPSNDEHAEKEDFFKHEDNAFDDPFFKDDAEQGTSGRMQPVNTKPDKKKRQRERDMKKQEAEEEKQRKAQLEMLLLDDTALQNTGTNLRGNEDEENMKGKLSRKARIAAKKAEKRAHRLNDSDNEDAERNTGNFHIDTGDQRFAALFDDANFALDPTDPRFQNNEANTKILQESSKRKHKKARIQGNLMKPNVQLPNNTEGFEHATSSDVKHLVAALKRKNRKPK